MAVLENLEPKKVWENFEELNKVPRETFDMDRISDYCYNWAKERGLDVHRDEVKNVIIKKPGTAGYEASEPVILQGHMDMVCEKVPGSTHNFKTDGLQLYIEDGFVRAKETSLGGDNGIAVAMAMAILESDDIPHPPLEVIFTVDEETGMGGAIGLDMSEFKGKKLLNMDSEDEGILTAGCAGGINYATHIPVQREQVTGTKLTVKVGGLRGGHSGQVIQQERGNANKLIGRLLNNIQRETGLSVIAINGGSKMNVITLESVAEFIVEDADKAKAVVARLDETWKEEFGSSEPGLFVELKDEGETESYALTKKSTTDVIAYIVIALQGVQEYSRVLEGALETSLNLGVIATTDTEVVAKYQIRSAMETKKWEIAERLKCLGELVGAYEEVIGEYPAWKYSEVSPLRDIMISTFEEMYGKTPEVISMHAGLECGYFMSKKPDLDIVSFGPEMFGVHSFNEKLDIASTQRTWDYLLNILAKCK